MPPFFVGGVGQGVYYLKGWGLFYCTLILALLNWGVAMHRCFLHSWCITPTNLKQIRAVTSLMAFLLACIHVVYWMKEKVWSDSQQSGACSCVPANSPGLCRTCEHHLVSCDLQNFLHYVTCFPKTLPALSFLSKVKEAVLGKALYVWKWKSLSRDKGNSLLQINVCVRVLMYFIKLNYLC